MVSPAPSGPVSSPTLPGCLVSIERHGVIGTNIEPPSLDAAEVVSTPPAPTVTATAAPIAAHRERQIDWARKGRVIASTVRADVVLSGRACALRSRTCTAVSPSWWRSSSVRPRRPSPPNPPPSRSAPGERPGLLSRCPDVPRARCGTIERPLDPRRSRRCHDHHRLRAPPRHQPQQAVARHHRRRRGRARLRVHRFARLLPRPVRTTARPSRHVARRCSRHGHVVGHQLPRARVVAGRLHRERPVVWRATRRRVRPLRHGLGRRRPRRRARRAGDRSHRPVRRLVRHVLRSVVRHPSSRSGPHAHARCRLPGRGSGPVVSRPEPGDARRVPPRV